MSKKKQTEKTTLEFLGSMKNRGWKFLFKTTDFEPKRLNEALGKVEKRFGSSSAKSIPKADLDSLFSEVQEYWTSHRELKGLLRMAFRKIPHVLFYPADEHGKWLGIDKDFCKEFADVLQSRDFPPRILSILLHQFLVHYPRQEPTFDAWRKLLDTAFTNCNWVRMLLWKRRANDLALFESNAPRSLASKLFSSTVKIRSILEDNGFSGELSGCGFLQAVQENLLSHSQMQLPSYRASEKTVRNILDFLEISEGTLRFKGTETSIADHLLLPWKIVDPSDGIQDLLREFFLRILGHPQLKTSNWYSVRKEAKEVMSKWLIKVTLEDFFRLVDDTAQDSHWRYRRAFWEAYLGRGVITKARLLLGPQVQFKARKFLRLDLSACGRLDGSGFQGNHSVLLMEIGHLVISEWSHSGKCRIWMNGSNQAPSFSKTRYERTDLTGEASFDFAHHHSEKGSWQQKCADYIRHQLGLHIGLPELMRGVR